MTQPSLPLETPAPAPPADWNGQLSELLGVLSLEAMEKPGRWAHRQLRGGALVAILLGPERRRILRIARADAPANDRARERWAFELATFHKYLGTAHWQPMTDEQVTGVAARFLELYLGEVEPGGAKCESCDKRIPFDRIWGSKQRCDACARRAGEAETKAIRERPADD